MSMLAAPRRKQKVINLRAKNNAWSNDATKFGQRMLEKMGWSSGKGLGAKENGIVDHVVAKYKNDDRGLGFEDRNDQWTKHEDDFNSLLANLSNGDNKDEKLHSGVSLEVKSKKSKARVHYHKFTRGKDLTRYSEKDLANIFGKKSLSKQEKQKQEEDAVNNDVEPKEQVFTDKGSMEDYFKSKLAAFKSKNKFNIISNYTRNNDTADYSFCGFSGATNDEDATDQDFGFQAFSSENNFVEKKNSTTKCHNTDISAETKKERKKKKKNEHQQKEPLEQENDVDSVLKENKLTNDTVTEESLKTKKSKKRKEKMDLEELVQVPEEMKPSKKKIKHIETIEEHVAVDYVPKKKKKRKNNGLNIE